MFAPRLDDDVTRWALAAKGGDRDAAEAFVRATQHDVRRFVAHLSSAAEAEDLSQETYLRAMRALRTFDARASARTGLLATARGVAPHPGGAPRRRPRSGAGPDWETVARRGAAGTGFDDGVVLTALLRDLEPTRREAFIATQVLGLDYAEAAEVCGCPIGTIRSRVFRARADLIAAMRADRDEPPAAVPRSAAGRMRAVGPPGR
jgi:RNA polymerase sigma-70 factor (ECF subfamily)